MPGIPYVTTNDDPRARFYANDAAADADADDCDDCGHCANCEIEVDYDDDCDDDDD